MDEVQVEVPVELVGRKEPGALKNFLAGGVGGICVVLSCHPLDTIKVERQTTFQWEMIMILPPQFC